MRFKHILLDVIFHDLSDEFGGVCRRRYSLKFYWLDLDIFVAHKSVSVYQIGENGSLAMVEEHVPPAGTGDVERIVLGPGGKHLYASTNQGTFQIWDRNEISGELSFLQAINEEIPSTSSLTGPSSGLKNDGAGKRWLLVRWLLWRSLFKRHGPNFHK